MSNSPLVNYTKISPNKTKGRNHAIDTITIHCVVGQVSVQSLGEIFQTKKASSNYGIGYDGKVGMYVEECDRSWCSSNSANDNRAITIECASDMKEPYAIKTVVYNKLIDLVTDICKRNGIKKLVWSTDKNTRVNHLNGCNMTCHRDYANKSCPGTYIYEREGKIAEEVNRRLNGDTPSPSGGIEVTTRVIYYKKGDLMKGQDVKSVQAIVGATQDGTCGAKTDKAIRAYQKAHGLKQDGMFGPACWQFACGAR